MGTRPSSKELNARIELLEKELQKSRDELLSVQEIKERYNSLFNQSLDGVYLMDLQGNILLANPAALNLVGYQGPVIEGLNFNDFLAENQTTSWRSVLSDIITTGSQRSLTEFVLKKPDGQYVYTESSGIAIFRDGKPFRIQGIIRDVTTRKIMEETLKQNWDALKNAPIGIYIVQDRKFVWVNQRFINETGYPEEALVGMEAMDLVVEPDRIMLREKMILMLKGQSTYPFEYRILHPKSRAERWVRGEVVSSLHNGRKSTLGYYSDIDTLMMQNIMDSLTGLYNRRYILQLTEQVLDNASRYNHPLSFIMLDIDHFKTYNDTFGHQEGDKALAKIGAVVKRVIRKVDIPGRYGGEEFCILLPDTPMEDARDVSLRLMHSIENETLDSDLARGLTISLGLSEFKNGMVLADLIRDADKNLYAAKSMGRNRMVY
ncbi:MAG: diguanylate cyclase [Proteobacteria bacterium]|nr:diguanylate cyclase [Pseudomonadota bacterium]MBU4471022.1 diguanylate cyclase [Pseudomonadota bacterium]MCG2753622.1 diguanylate cyclase [Desulfobacteraceae bacterium]